jgi:cytochrome c-type biogenesis protein CcmH
MKSLRIIFAVLFLTSSFAVVHSYEPDEVLQDARLEARARKLSSVLRCLVCQNQSIDDSSAPLARDLRLIIRERLTNGDTNPQVIDFVVARYGEFVLLMPRFAPHTWALWLTAPVLLLLGAFGLFIRQRRQAGLSPPPPLSKAEKSKLKKLLD